MQNALHFDCMVRKLRSFFQKKGYVEIPAQSRVSILAACEDPKTIAEYDLGGARWPLPQTGQMWLEFELLKNPELPGVFSLSTSYRDEPNIVEGRHHRIFPMFEFEGKGTIEDLQKTEIELLTYLGFQPPASINYEDACQRYETDLISTEHEMALCNEISSSILLEKFPLRSDPYWNMKYAGNDLFEKIDVIMYGMETIGSAERACNAHEMRTFFDTVSDGDYKRILFEKFGKDRVMKEFNNYLSLDFFPRFGGGIGLTRLENAFIQAGLFDIEKEYTPAYTYGYQAESKQAWY